MHHTFCVTQFRCPAWLSTFLRIDLKVVFQRSSSSDFNFLIREHHRRSQVLVFRHQASPVSHIDASSQQVGCRSSFRPISLVLGKLNLFLQICVVASPVSWTTLYTNMFSWAAISQTRFDDRKEGRLLSSMCLVASYFKFCDITVIKFLVLGSFDSGHIVWPLI